MNFELTERQRHLLVCCINAELEMSRQGDTSLSLSETADIDENDEDLLEDRLDNLQDELRALAKLFRGN